MGGSPLAWGAHRPGMRVPAPCGRGLPPGTGAFPPHDVRASPCDGAIARGAFPLLGYRLPVGLTLALDVFNLLDAEASDVDYF